MKQVKSWLSSRCCPKCLSKNIYLDSDEYGVFEHCLQCGYLKDKAEIKEKQNTPGSVPGLAFQD
jgi:hypothetical protein